MTTPGHVGAGGFDLSLMQGNLPPSAPPAPPARRPKRQAPQPPSMPTTKLELTLRCQDLPKSDLFSKSDPMCVVYLKDSSQAEWTEVGRTEVINDDHDPKWAKKVEVNYSFETKQQIKFAVYDIDSSSPEKLGEQELLGRYETTMAYFIKSQNKLFTAVLKDSPGLGSTKAKIFANIEETGSDENVVQLQLSAHDLEKKDTFGKSDPYYILSKSTPSGQFALVHRSEVVEKNLNPNWKPVNLTMRELCSGDPERPLRIDVYDWDKTSDHDLIGCFTTNFNQLKAAYEDKGRKFEVINKKKEAKKKSYNNSGLVSVKCLAVCKRYTFCQYLQAGTKMNFSVAIDFTSSNGFPSEPESLHYRDPARGGENQYTMAIRAVGDIIQEYDDDKMFPGLGFGAKVPPNNNAVNHEFFLNLDPVNPGGGNPFCNGVDGILRGYSNALGLVELNGPTNFAPVINHVARFAEQATRDQNLRGTLYYVLLIITDGEITDMDETKRAIVSASNLPMSIIIVGVGENRDFSSMEELDGDDGRLKSPTGVAATRDIVQFVEFSAFFRKESRRFDREALAQQVLAEIPHQLVGWMNNNNIDPEGVKRRQN